MRDIDPAGAEIDPRASSTRARMGPPGSSSTKAYFVDEDGGPERWPLLIDNQGYVPGSHEAG